MAYDKADIVNVLVNRDGMDREDAWDLIEDAQSEIDALVSSGVEGIAGLYSAEDIIKDYFGLESDYLMGFIGC